MFDVLRRMIFAGMLISVTGLLIFSYGFQMIRIPPSGFGIPLAEIMLGASLPFMFTRPVVRDLFRSPVVLGITLWIVVGSIRIAFDASTYGMVAVRDGLSVLEAAFFFAGFAMASRAWFMGWILRMAPWFVGIVIVHSMMSIIAPTVAPYTPHLPSTQGMMIPVFFKYTTMGQVLIVLAVTVTAVGVKGPILRFLPGFLVVLALVLFPSRTALLQLVGSTIAFMVFAPKSRRPKRGPVLATLILGVVGTMVVANSGLGVAGRLGHMSASDYVQLVAEMRPTAGPNRHDSLSSGTGQRLMWWTDIAERVFASPTNAMLGLGFGIPLIEFRVTELVVAREPHNTLVGVLGRLGIPGLIIYLIMTYQIAVCSIRQVRARLDSPLAGLAVFIASYILCTLICGIGESPFTVPAFTVPYYFVAGLVARMDVRRPKPIAQASDPTFGEPRPVLAAAPLERSNT